MPFDPVMGQQLSDEEYAYQQYKRSNPGTGQVNAYGDTQGMRMTPGGFYTMDNGRGTPDAPQSGPAAPGAGTMPQGIIGNAMATKPAATTGPTGVADAGSFGGTYGAYPALAPAGVASAMGAAGDSFNQAPAGSWTAPADGVTYGSTKPFATTGPQGLGVATFGGSATPYPTTGPQGVADATNPAGTAPSTGIIGSALNGAPQATPWNVTANQTVAGQVNALTDPNSPLIVQARTRALQEANNRGIINSSLATSAADSAAYAAALPIAQADAATYGKAAGYNVDQINSMGLQSYLANLQADTSRYGTDVSAATSRYGTDASASTSKYNTDSSVETAKLNAETSKTIAGLNNEAQATANKLRNDNDKLLNTNSQAAAAFNGAMNAVANINLNDKMDAASKTRAAAQVYAQLQSQLRVLGKTSGLDLNSTVSFANEPGFDAQGNYVGFNDDNTTVGRAPPPPAAVPTGPVQNVDEFGRPIGGNVQ